MPSVTQSITYDTPGTYTWTAPDNVTAVWAMILGAGSGGGAGGGASGPGGGGGGSGNWVHNKLIPCAGGTLTIVVGAGGAGAGYSGNGSAGGDSSVDIYIAPGSGTYPGFNWGKDGGGIFTRRGNGSVSGGAADWGVDSSPFSYGGAGGGGNTADLVPQQSGAGAPGTAARSTSGTQTSGPSFTNAGCGGGNSPFGRGGNGGSRSLSAGTLSGEDAPLTSYGAGGGGAGSASSGDYGFIAFSAGDGAGGIVILTWISNAP